MSNLVPPPLLELDPGGRPAVASIGPAGAVIRLGARVVAMSGPDPVIETAQGRAVLRDAPPLRPGATLIMELPRGDAAPARTGRLVSVEQQRLEPPVPIRLQPAPAAQPAATVRTAAGLEVEVRPLTPQGRPVLPKFTARLVPIPEPGPFTTGSRAAPPPPAAGGGAGGSVAPGAGVPARGAMPTDSAMLPATARAGAPPSAPATAPGAPATTKNPPLPTQVATPEQARLPALRNHPIEVIVVRRDARGRVSLRGAELTFEVETPVKLPVGARLQLIVPAALPRPEPAAPESKPLKAVRDLATLLGEQGEAEQPPSATAPRLPQATATLAARLLRLVQLIAQRSGETAVRRATAAAADQAHSGTPRITAALVELGRLAGEPQPGGWRAFMLPLGFEGTPMLRLYLREEPDQDHDGTDRRSARSGASRRAVFELEFGMLGRCQIDALCQAQRLDLIVRTEQPLEPDASREIRELYAAARDAAGLLGELRFGVGAWLCLPEPTGAGAPGAGITV